jgi:5'-3' exonuclease
VGVKNWGNVIPWRWTSVEELEPRVIAFDTPNYISRRLSVIPSRKAHRVPMTHIHILLATVFSCLRSHVLPVFVFDGPPEHLKRKTNPQLRRTTEYLYRRWVASDEDYLRDHLGSFSSPAVRLYFAMHHIKDVCAACGIPIVSAPSEAEMAAAVLCREGKVGTVASNDADALLFGATHVTRSIRLSKGEIERALLSDFEARLDLDLEQMRDLAILCGCDFSKRGVRGVGPRKGAIGLRRHGNLENFLKARGLLQTEIEEYLKARGVFDEGHFFTMRIDSLALRPPVTGRVIHLLEPALGAELAKKRASELLGLWKGFGRVQMTLEGWIS